MDSRSDRLIQLTQIFFNYFFILSFNIDLIKNYTSWFALFTFHKVILVS